jgi:hypothetical protein
MKNTSLRRALRRALLLLMIALVLLVILTSCTPEVDYGDSIKLSDQFMDHVIADDYDSAYSMVKATVTDPDFRDYWETIRSVAEGAETYTKLPVQRNATRSGGVTTITTAYQVNLDNGRIVLLRVVTQDGIEGIAGIHFSDITEFIHTTDTYVPVLQAIVLVFSLLCMAFTIWMFVDCLRRKMKYKLVWAILTVFGIALNLTVGETFSFSFNIGLFVQMSTVQVDPGLVAVVSKLVIPVGAILYLCLRKKFTVEPSKPEGEDLPDPFAQTETEPTAEADDTAQTEADTTVEADTQEGGEES